MQARQRDRNTGTRLVGSGIKKCSHIVTDTQNINKWVEHSDKEICPESQGCKDTKSIYTWGHLERETHKEVTKATNKRMETVNQIQGHRDTGSKRKRHRSRHQTQTDGDTEVVSQIKTKPGTEQDRKRSRCREIPCQTDP